MSFRKIIAAATSLLWVKAASGVCVVLIAVLSLIPQEERVSMGLPGVSEHFIAYSLTGLLLGLSIPGKLGPLLAAVHLTGLGCLLEFLQQWSPGRHPRVSDAVIGAAAGALGAAIAAWLRKRAEMAFTPHGN